MKKETEQQNNFESKHPTRLLTDQKPNMFFEQIVNPIYKSHVFQGILRKKSSLQTADNKPTMSGIHFKKTIRKPQNEKNCSGK